MFEMLFVYYFQSCTVMSTWCIVCPTWLPILLFIKNRPGGNETICPTPAADGCSTRGASTSVADGSAVRTSLLTGQLQAASVPRLGCSLG